MSNSSNDRKTVKRRRESSAPRMHQITFCTSCEEAIPVNAHSCFRCGTRQPGADGSVQVLFCEKCGSDFPAKAMACYHCGHLNAKHPYLTGHIAS